MLALFRGLAAHLDPLVFLFLLGLAGLFRLLGSKSRQSSQTEEPPTTTPEVRPELPQRDQPDSDEERIRRFLEALGQPPPAQPPPPVRPRPVATSPEPQFQERARTVRPRRNLVNPLPSLTTTPPPLPKRVQLPRQITRPPYAERPLVAPPPQSPVFEVQEGQGTPRSDEPVAVKTPGDAYAIATTPAPAVQIPSSLAAELRAPGTLRRAILLREILGPPRALQPLEL